MTANADYGVSIVESFTPPKMWVPGQEVDKDVYATNTGSIPTFVREDVSATLTRTIEKTVDATNETSPIGSWSDDGVYTPPAVATDATTQFEHFVELTEKEKYYSVEAGSYLAYKPTASKLKLGTVVVAYSPEDATKTTQYVAKYKNSTNEDVTITITADQYDKLFGTSQDAAYRSQIGALSTPANALLNESAWTPVTTTAAVSDFTPDAEGLYVFRRSVDVDRTAHETFEYDGYYYKDGHYYKVTDLKLQADDSVTPNVKDELDRAGDGNDKDGQLATAVANFLVEETEVLKQPTTYTYDAANNRLVFEYGVSDKDAKLTAYDTAADTLDKAEHELAEYRAILDKAILEQAKSNADVAHWNDVISQLNAAIAELQARIDALGNSSTGIIGNLTTRVNGLKSAATGAETSANNALKDLYGSSTPYTFVHDTTPTTDDAGWDARYDDLSNANCGKINYGTAGSPNYTEPTDKSVIIDTSSKLYKLLDARDAIEAYRVNNESAFEGYLKELNNKYSTNYTYDQAIKTFTKTELEAVTYPVGDQYHDIHALTLDYIAARDAYNAKMQEFKSAVADYKNNVQRLGKKDSGTESDGTKSETVAGQSISYAVTKVDADATGAQRDLAAAQAEKATKEAKKTALEDTRTAAYQSAADATKVNGTDATTAMNTAFENYRQKAAAYDEALYKFEQAKKAYETSDSLKIYVNLSDDVVTYGGTAEKWQLLNPELDDLYSFTPEGVAEYKPDNPSVKDTAIFYYTSILEGGETSKKLIDSVEMDSGVTQDMYKNFDFDLNVALKSVQVTYNGDGSQITTDAVPGELDANAALADNTNIDTAVTWSKLYTPDTTATTFTAHALNASGAAVTITPGTYNIAGKTFTYQIMDGGSQYYGNSVERGADFQKYNGTDALLDEYITLTENATKAT